jgi:glycosyltransferase involved in cell wall biosynthesis
MFKQLKQRLHRQHFNFMRIGIDARPLREPQTSGIPMYVRSLLSHLLKIDQENEYILYAHKDFELPFNFKNVEKKTGALTRYGSVWMQMELPFWLKRDKIDVFWGTQHILPLMVSRDIKTVLTIHDLIHYVFPKTMKPLNFVINKLIIPSSVRRADFLVAISNWTLSDVFKYLQPIEKRSKVVHLAIGKQFKPQNINISRKIVKDKFGIDFPYILSVGTFEPRKNIGGLFNAFSSIADKIPHHLVVVGQKGWKNKKSLEEITLSQYHDRVHLIGYVDDEFIPYIYSAADVFVFPSFYEGFGLPPLEAMACGVAVITSNVSSLPEVVGDAAVLTNPRDPAAIGLEIIKILQDLKLRESLIKKGQMQISKFSWEKTAKEMLEIFETVHSR